MSAQPVPDDRSHCPDCGQGTLEPQVRTEQFHYGEGKDKVLVEAENVPVEICTHCQETFSGPEAARIRHNAICRALGLLTPEEIEALRKRLGLSQADLADLTGIGKATISRWERRWSLQNKAMDRYLRLLAANPDNVCMLKQIQAPPPEQQLCRDGTGIAISRSPFLSTPKGVEAVDTTARPDNALQELSPLNSAKSCAGNADPDLQRVVEAWPSLPPYIRAAVLALLQTVAKTA